jgi:hypothetical protein
MSQDKKSGGGESVGSQQRTTISSFSPMMLYDRVDV